jgi:hypothetical protein
MSPGPPPSCSPSADERRAVRLLGLARLPPRRAVDLLLEDLAARGPGRLEELLASGPVAALGRPFEALAGGGPSLAELAESKERCKAAEEHDLHERLGRMAGYFTVIAAALVHHRTRITTRPARDLEPILLDLAAAIEGRWSELFARASSLAGCSPADTRRREDP